MHINHLQAADTNALPKLWFFSKFTLLAFNLYHPKNKIQKSFSEQEQQQQEGADAIETKTKPPCIQAPQRSDEEIT